MMMTDAQRAMVRTYGTLVGRVVFGAFFLYAGWNKLTGEGGVTAFSGNIPEALPLPLLVAWIVVLVEIVGGALLILGYRTGQAAGALALFLLLTVVFVHNPLVDGAQTMKALNNLALMAGALYFLAYGPGDGWKLGT